MMFKEKKGNNHTSFTNKCNNPSVNVNLEDGEEIIRECTKFDYKSSKKSILGTKRAYITSLGRIIACDEGGIFVEKSCYISSNVKYNFNPYSCDFNLACTSTFFSINAKLSVEDYLKFSSEIDRFTIDYENLFPIIYIGDYHFSADIKLDNSSILISDLNNEVAHAYKYMQNIREDIKIELRFIKKISYDKNYKQCIIEFFSEEVNDIVKCKIIFLNENTYNEIKYRYDCKLNLFDYLTDREDKIYCEKISMQNEFEDNSSIHFAYVADKQNNLIIIHNENIQILDYNNYSVKINLNKKDCLFIKNPYCVETYIDYKNGILLLSDNTKVEEDSIIQLSELEENYCFIKEDNFYLIKVNILENYIQLICKSGEYNINYKDVKSLDLLDVKDGQVARISVMGLKKYELILKNKLYLNLMEKWVNSKVKDINDLNLIYYTWSKSLRDIIIYYYFSIPSELKGTFDNLLKNGRTIECLTKNEKIKMINLMYDVLKKYKSALMEFSGYFSNELFSEQAKDNNVKFKSSFDILQREMININNQINRHIDSSISNLNYLAPYIYPELDVREALNNKNVERSIISTVAYAGLGIITGGIGFIAMAGFQGVGLFDSLDRSKISDNMEEAKVNIFLNNAVNEFNIFIDNMLPKYINDINNVVSNLVNSIKGFYSEEDIDFLKICVYNNMLFLEAPINETVLKSKQLLINFINNKAITYKTDFLDDSSINSKKISRSEYHKQLKGGV